jgi:hypothetical protein
VPGSRQEQYDLYTFTANISYVCLWNERYARIEQVRNLVYDATHKYFEYFLPAICTKISVSTIAENFDKSPLKDVVESQYAPYTLAKLAVSWKGIARPGNWTITESMNPEVYMRQIPSWGFIWRSDGSPALDSEAPAVQEVKATITRSMKGFRRIPNWFFSLIGRVNVNEWYDSITGIVYAPDTLLFQPTSFSRSISMQTDDDDRLFDFDYTLNWNPVGWNSWIRPHGIDRVLYDGQRVFMYPPVVFPNLEQLDEVNRSGIPPYIVALPNYDGSYHRIYVNDGNGDNVAGVTVDPDIPSEMHPFVFPPTFYLPANNVYHAVQGNDL